MAFLHNPDLYNVTLGDNPKEHFIYLGKSFVPERSGYTLRIINVWITEALRGQGTFTRFLDHVEHNPKVVRVEVSDIKDENRPHLNEFFRRRGYQDKTVCCIKVL